MWSTYGPKSDFQNRGCKLYMQPFNEEEKITDPHLWVQRIRKIMNYNVLSLLGV